MPAAWIFAFLIVFGADAIFSNRATIPSDAVMTPAQVLIAMLCAGPLATVSLVDLVGYLVPAAVSLGVTFAVCIFGAWLLRRVNRVDWATGLLSTLAGGSSGIVLVAREVKANVQFVTLTQYMRLSVIVVTLPLLVSWLASFSDATASTSTTSVIGVADGGFWASLSSAADEFWRTSWQGVVGAIVVGVTVWLVLQLTRRFFSVPSPYLLLSMMVVIIGIAAGVPQEFVMPDGLVLNAAYAVVGVQAGGTLTKQALRKFGSAVPVIVGVLLLMVGSSVLTGWLISVFSRFSVLDAYLATVPGGVYAVLAFAHDSGSDPIVTVVQVLRVIVMLVAAAYAPSVINAIRRRGKRRETVA